MTFDINKLEKFEVLTNDTTDVDSILNTQKEVFIKNIESKILDIIDEDEFIDIDDNIENLSDVSDKIIEKIHNNFELKKYILTYAFWKYRDKGSSKKFDSVKMKKFFGIKRTEKIEDNVYHIEYKLNCPLCNNEGSVSIESNSKKKRTFVCHSCGHTHKTFEEENKNKKSYVYCDCTYCKNVKIELRNHYNNLVLNNLKECEDIIKELPVFLDKVEDETMKRHFILQTPNLCKDTRQIIGMNPKDIDDLTNIKKDIAEKTEYLDAEKYLESIDKKLVDKNIIYEYFERKESIDPYELLWSSMGVANYRGNDAYHYSKSINKLLYDINNNEDFFENLRDDNSYYFNYYLSWWTPVKMDPDLSISISKEDIKEHCYDKKFMLNPYFFKKDIVVNDKKNINLKSPGEESMYSVLLNLYPSSEGYKILTNPRLSEYIDMEYIYFLLQEEKANYVSRCYVDFLILKNEVPYKVYELQKGKHHNDKEWIRKDRIKKGACLLSGLEFEEYY